MVVILSNDTNQRKSVPSSKSDISSFILRNLLEYIEEYAMHGFVRLGIKGSVPRDVFYTLETIPVLQHM